MPRVLVASQLDGDLLFFDATTRKRLGNVKVGASPQGLTIARNGRMGYVTAANEGTLSSVDVIRMKETGRVALEGLADPGGLVPLADGRSVAIASVGEPKLCVMDATTGAARATIMLDGKTREPPAMSRAGDRAYVACPDEDVVLAIDVRKGAVVERFPVEGHPRAVALRKDGRVLLVATGKPPALQAIDLRDGSLSMVAEVGSGPCAIAAHPYKNEAFVLSKAAGALFHVDLDAKTSAPPLPVGLGPEGLALAMAGKRVYVTNAQANTVAVVDTQKRDVVDVWDAGHAPGPIVFL